MMKKVIISAILLMLVYGTSAQNAEDALRYSRIFYGGTARFQGLSGAFGALGADFSTLSTNPAGLGLYKGSEMTLTFTPHIFNASSEYNGTKAKDNSSNFGMGNFGAVFSIYTGGQPGSGALKSINFGIGFNRHNDFNSVVPMAGINDKNSMMQSYADILNAENVAPDSVVYKYPFDIGLAYQTNLVYYDSATESYYCDAAFGGVLQNKYIESYGALTETDFSISANLDEKLYLGFTFGVPYINYHQNSVYKESATGDTIPNFLSLRYDYSLYTRGAGIVLKFGAIYKPEKWMRIGLAIHTPTWYSSMRDDYSSYMQSSFTNTSWNNYSYSPAGFYDYKLRTPFRAMGSLGFIIGPYGVVAADYEFVNYGTAHFKSDLDSYYTVNNDISNSFKSGNNFRLGTEWRLMDFRLRGGFAYFNNPYKSGLNDLSRIQVSGGLGYRSKFFFADVAYVWSTWKEQYYLYDPAMVNPVSIKHNSHLIATTIGFRF